MYKPKIFIIRMYVCKICYEKYPTIWNFPQFLYKAQYTTTFMAVDNNKSNAMVLNPAHKRDLDKNAEKGLPFLL